MATKDGETLIIKYQPNLEAMAMSVALAPHAPVIDGIEFGDPETSYAEDRAARLYQVGRKMGFSNNEIEAMISKARSLAFRQGKIESLF